MSEFDPFDPNTWAKPHIAASADEEYEENVSQILDNYKRKSELFQILNYLLGNKTERDFKKRLKSDKELQHLINWLEASDYRRERAVKQIFAHIESVICPRCHSTFHRSEVIDYGNTPFDWQRFADEDI